MEELCYPTSHFIWASANWYCNFHIIFMYYALQFPLCLYCNLLYPFIDRTRKQTVLIKWFFLAFVKGWPSVQRCPPAQRTNCNNWNKEQDTLSSIVIFRKVYFLEKPSGCGCYFKVFKIFIPAKILLLGCEKIWDV